MKRYAILVCLLSVPSFASVVMIPEITPDPVVDLLVGDTMDIGFASDEAMLISFFGAVEWVGAGELSEPVYPLDPGIIPPDPPYEPGLLPDNMWPIFYVNMSPAPIVPDLFAMTTYFADEAGNATINLYEFTEDFSEFILLDSFTIVVVPEPLTAVLLSLGILLARRR